MKNHLHRRATAGRAHMSAWSSKLLRRQFPSALWSGTSDTRQVALTFDDGPNPHDTPLLLDSLARQQVHATFFHLGELAEQQPDLVRAVAAGGHQVAMHGYRHRAFPLEVARALRSQLTYTQELLAALSGRTPDEIRDVRPPFGMYTRSTLRALIGWGYRPVMWSVVPFHWMQPAEATIAQTLRLAHPGAVLVLHESLGGPPVAELAEAIIVRLHDQGYRFVSVEQMWQTHETTDHRP